MTTITYGPATEEDISTISQELLSDIDGDITGWKLYEAQAYKGDYTHSHCLQIVFSAADKRAGITLVGSGSSGHTDWTDAASPEDALRRYVEDDMSN